MDQDFKAFLSKKGITEEKYNGGSLDAQAKLVETFEKSKQVGTTSHDPMNAYLDLLRLHPTIQNQPTGANYRVVGLIAKDRGLHAAMMGCVTPAQAFELYTRALQVLSTHAKLEIEQFLHQTLLIDGRIDLEAPSNTFIYRAFQPVGAFLEEFYFKVKGGADLGKEELVWQRIRDKFGPDEAATFFIETTLVQVNRPLTNHPGVTSGLLSPIMLGTLFELPVSVTKHLVKVVYTAMKRALSMMHGLNMVHCDLKPQNIFRDSKGRYHLADYDGCVSTGAAVDLSTRSFWPLDMQQQENSLGRLPATPQVDFAMLAATLLFLADRWNFLTVTQPTLADMRTTALTMKTLNECGADEILECITLA